MAWTPYDLPHLIQRFGAATAAQTRFMHDALADVTLDGGPAPSFARATVRERMITDLVENSALYWMDDDVCALVRATAPGLPDWTPEELAPVPHGVIAFEKQVLTYPDPDAGTVTGLNVDAIGWQVTDGQLTVHALSLRRGARRSHDTVLHESVARIAPQVTLPPESTLASPLTDVSNVTVGLTDTVKAGGSISVDPGALPWNRGAGPDGGHSTSGGLTATAMTVHSGLHAPVLRILGATWALLRQRDVLTPAAPAESRVRVTTGNGDNAPGTARTPRRQLVRVSVYRLSPDLTDLTDRSGNGGGHGPAVHRWWVRGHWRRQPWGKKQSQRRLVYILPHTAGSRAPGVPEPSPTSTPTVTVVRR